MMKVDALITDDAFHDSIAALLSARGRTHGDFGEHANITQTIKAIVNLSPNGADLTDVHREAIDMIAHKIGRICAGDPDFRDHWDDIAGYARLAADRCTK